ncbi:MAG TPA: hypothetical protein VGB24_13530 [Longimicrobium sp.]|jgi:hypothetical protein|uniref:hypothetical protein n=1 Tax=Longimicrobium sp. TaxID=2029185 RepID=UPI002ED78D06
MTKPVVPPVDPSQVPDRDQPRRVRQPWEEEIYQRALKSSSFGDMFTPEQWDLINSTDWPSALVGPPPPPPMKRRPRRRGEPPREG